MTQPKAYSYIRFSKPKQAQGDSERRQSEDINPEKIAKKLDLPLDDKLNLIDRGKSGWKGTHRTEGALGEFEKAIENNEIAQGSVLIIEEWDRLTREALLKSVHLMTSILLKKVGIYTGADDQLYAHDDFDFGQLVLSANKLMQGHEESEKKSRRLKSAWQEKRQKVSQGIPLTRTCPQWCKPVEDKQGNHTGFAPVKEVAKVVQEMYQMKAAGKGAAKIKNELNKRDDLYKPENGWAKGTINRYLRSKKVLGQFELHKRKDGKRVSTGEIVQNYYPQIIDTDLWYEAKAVFDANGKAEGNKGGRGQSENNLFRHIEVLCNACKKGKMMFDDHGRYKYLRCKNHHRHNGCTEARSVNYLRIFEPLMLRYCHGLEVSDILPTNGKRQQEISSLNSELQSTRGKLSELDKAIENRDTAINAAESEQMVSFHNEKLAKLIGRQSENEQKKESLRIQLNQLSQSKKQTAEQLKNVQELIQRLDNVTGDDRIDLRIKLRTQLQNLIAKISIGFHTLDEFGQEETYFDIIFKNDVRRILALIDDKLVEVITVEDHEVDIKDIARQRQREANRNIQINQ
jgi:hypothetical protein